MSIYYCEGKYRSTNFSKFNDLLNKISQKEETDPVWNKDKETIDKIIKEIQAETRDVYQVWLDNGHEGSEEDFLNWLKTDTIKIEERLVAQEKINEDQQTQIDANTEINASQQNILSDVATEEDIENLFKN